MGDDLLPAVISLICNFTVSVGPMVTLFIKFLSFIQQDALVNLKCSRHLSYNYWSEQTLPVSVLFRSLSLLGESDHIMTLINIQLQAGAFKEMEFDSMRRLNIGN